MSPRLTRLASSTGKAGATRSNSALPSSSAGPPTLSRSANAASCALSWPVIDAMRSAQVAIESAVCTWEFSTGGDWSINCVIGSWFLPASLASDVDPSTMRDSSGPSPATALSASSTTVRRLSCGIACSALLVASSRPPMSGGICALPTGMTSPSRSGASCRRLPPAGSVRRTVRRRPSGCAPPPRRRTGILRRRVELQNGTNAVGGDVDRRDPADLGAAIGHDGRRVQTLRTTGSSSVTL